MIPHKDGAYTGRRWHEQAPTQGLKDSLNDGNHRIVTGAEAAHQIYTSRRGLLCCSLAGPTTC